MEKNKIFDTCLANGISTDTRKLDNGKVFIALKGSNFDGNKYCELALNNGASLCISDNSENASLENVILVSDSLVFLQELAHYKRKQLNIPVIGITGSNGKTTNKELINAVLSKKYKTSSTKGNLNNHIGVPFTILDITEDIEIAIVEMGANKPGDIKELAEIAQPNYGLITNIGSAHLEGFKNLEGVIKTKKELYDYLETQAESKVIYNCKDPVLKKILPNTLLLPFGDKTNLFADHISVSPYLNFSYSYLSYQSPIIKTHLIGDYNISNFLAAILFGVEFGVEFEDINDALSNYTPDNNRSQLTKTERNELILDCYNSNPSSLNAALINFSNIQNGSKLCIIGDMLELGNETIKEHQKIIDLVSQFSLNTIFVGPIFLSLIPNNHTGFKDVDDLISNFDLTTLENNLVLLKGSRGIQLEKIKDYL